MLVLPLFQISENVIINIKHIKMFTRRDDGAWSVFFDRADPQPLTISNEQYEELIEEMMEKKEEKLEGIRMRVVPERSISRDLGRQSLSEVTLRKMGF